MKRIALIAATGLLTLPAGAAGLSALARARAVVARALPVSAQAPRALLAGFSCHPAFLPRHRSMYVRAVMRPVTGTVRMQMRFQLWSNLLAPGVPSLHGAGLDTWISPPNPTLGQRLGDVWIVPHPVRNLEAPATYQYRVTFRWIGAAGRIIQTRSLDSPDCAQRELRPDLLVSSIAVAANPANPMTDQYVAAIKNQGVTGAGGFAVTFTAGGSATGGAPVVKTKTINHLGPGATKDVTFMGPLCTSSTAPTVVVDPDHTVHEYDYTNNSLTVAATCPALTTAAVPGA